jgi:hypothetical protein
MKGASRAFLLAIVGCVSAPVTEERLLDMIPAGVNVIVPVAYSRDGRRAAYVARTQEGDRVVCGEWTGSPRVVV